MTAFECLMVTEGKLDFYLDGEVHHLTEGDFVIINPCEVHGSCCVDEGTRAFLLQFPESQFSSIKGTKFQRKGSPFIRYEFDDNHPFLDEISRIFSDIDAIKPESGIGYHLHMKSQLYAFLYTLIKNNAVEQVSVDSARTDKHLSRLNKIMCYIENNYHTKITLEECSKQIHVDSTYFSRFFKKYMGENFSRYLSLYRMNHAYNELISTDFKITEIAEKNGFTNYKYFLSLFKEIYGCPPLDIRQKMQKHDKFDASTPKTKKGSFQQMYCH